MVWWNFRKRGRQCSSESKFLDEHFTWCHYCLLDRYRLIHYRFMKYSQFSRYILCKLQKNKSLENDPRCSAGSKRLQFIVLSFKAFSSTLKCVHIIRCSREFRKHKSHMSYLQLPENGRAHVQQNVSLQEANYNSCLNCSLNIKIALRKQYSVMEVSSVSRGSPPGQLRSGMIILCEIPTLGDKLLSNFPRGRGGAMGRGSFHAKVLVLFIKNGRLPLQLIKRKYGGNAGGLSEKVL